MTSASCARNIPHWAQRLSDAGYRTGYFGKWHVERTNELERFGWQVNGCNQAAAFRAIGAGDGGRGNLLDHAVLEGYKEGPEGYNRVLHYGVTDVPTEERDFARITQQCPRFSG